MITKKNSRFDLERKRFVLLQIGLLTAGSLTLAAFTYTETVDIVNEKHRVLAKVIDVEVLQIEEKIEEPVQQPQKKQVQQNDVKLTQKNPQLSDNIVKADNSDNPDIDAGIDGIIGIPKGPSDIGDFIDVKPDDEVDIFPPIPTSYIGGHSAMIEHINNEVKYPQIDIEFGVEGKVFLSFIVEKDGSVSNVKVVRGVSPTLDREAVRIVYSFPKWKPAENAYGPVRTLVQLPISFKIKK